MTLLEALGGSKGWTLHWFGEFIHRPDEWLALWRSLWISAASVLLAALIGIPLAFLFERAEFPGRRVLGALVALPVALPPLAGVIAFLFLYGESGFLSPAGQALPRLDGTPRPAGPGALGAPAGGPAAAGGGDRLPLPLRRERLRLAGGAGPAAAGGSPLAAHRTARHPAGAPLLDVRLLLPVPPRRAHPPGRGAAGGRFLARRRALARPRPGDPAAAAAGARRSGPAHLHDRSRLVLRPLPLRRRLPGDDHPDRRLQAQRRGRPRPGRDGDARRARPAGAGSHAPGRPDGLGRHRSAGDRAGPPRAARPARPRRRRPLRLAA